MSLKGRVRLLGLRTLGVGAGRLLGLLAWLPALRPPLASGRQVAPRVLVVRPDHLGDLLLTTPALSLLRRSLPARAEITCLVGPWARPALLGNPDVDRLLSIPFPGFTRAARRPHPLGPYLIALRYALILRRAGPFDAALILRDDHWWGALLVYLAGVPLRIGVRGPEAAPFLTTGLPPSQCTGHRAEQNLTLARALLDRLGVVPASDTPAGLRAPVSPADRAAATALLAAHGVGSGETLVALQTGAGAALKLWSVEAWGAVGLALARRYQATLVLVGSASERELAERVASMISIGDPTVRCCVLAGATSWGVLAAALDRCALVVGVDSGTMHLAVARSRPSVAIFGPVDPRLFGPWGDPEGASDRHAVVAAALPCQPCGRLDYCRLRPAGGPPPMPCLRAVTPGDVLEAAGRVMMKPC